MPDVWVNNNFVDENAASISLRDAGLLHGAGVFTTMRAHRGKVFQFPAHLRRLRDSCEALFIPLSYKDDVLERAAADLLSRNELSDARLRLTVTRGTVIQDPLHGMRVEPNVFLTATQFEPYPLEYYQRGLTVVLLDEQKLNPYDLQAGHKTLDYFSRLAALREANRRKAGEALWFNVHNYLQSASVSNVILVENGKLITPPTAEELRDPLVAGEVPYSRSNVLPGITRAAVMALAREAGMEVQTAAVDVGRLLEAQELFLTNSIMGVMPVCRIEQKALGDDRPGPITLQLANALREQMERETTG
jgi:branched-subunit amino acid aminotransferase/4-amino-4-deoxychorismate lyase